MEDREFNNLLDKYLSTGKMTPDEYEQLNDEQKFIIQTIKRAFARIKSKLNE